MLCPAALVLFSMLTAGVVPYDTVRLADGGLVRGTVVEDTAEGVTLELPSGGTRRWTRAEVASVEYASPAPPAFSPPATPPPAPPAAAVEARPEAAQPEAAPERAPFPFTASLGLGAAGTTGQVGSVAGKTSDWWNGFALIQAEAGFRIAQRWTTLVYLDGGGGDVADPILSDCRAQGYDCGAGSVRVGVMERYTFAPTAPRTPWLAIGTGYESTGVMVKGTSGTQYIAFQGWEALKLAGGYDFRLSRWFGLGLFAGASVASYQSVHVDGPRYRPEPVLGEQRYHYWFQVGGRAILFP